MNLLSVIAVVLQAFQGPSAAMRFQAQANGTHHHNRGVHPTEMLLLTTVREKYTMYVIRCVISCSGGGSHQLKGNEDNDVVALLRERKGVPLHQHTR